MINKLNLTLLAACSALMLAGCGNEASADASDAPALISDNPVIIYTNADEEAQRAIKTALDGNGFKGAYLMQSFGTSELGGKLTAEGVSIEADVVTLSQYYLESLQRRQHLFAPLSFERKPLVSTSDYYAPILGLSGSVFINTYILKEDGLRRPNSIADLADPAFEGNLSIPDITGSSTSWLMTLALVDAYGEERGIELARRIEKNAGAHLEKSGSGPLKMLRAGEVAAGFGLRHQAVADKARELPIDYVDPVEGNFTIYEAAAVIDKGPQTHPDAQKVIEIIVRHARAQLIKDYPVALYEGETVPETYRPAHPKSFGEPLTVELLKKHQRLVKEN